MPDLTLTDAHGDEAAAEALDRMLLATMIEATGRDDYAPLTIALRDEAGALQGGLDGFTWGGWLYIETLVVAGALRGGGWGTRLMDRAEATARARGCTGVLLETHSFQARPFYEARGYTVFATVEAYPPGHELFFLRKRL